MRPGRWRRSTHVAVGLAVVALVVVVVAVAALMTRHGAVTAAAVRPAPALVTLKPGIVAVADTAPAPAPGPLAATMAPALANPDLGQFTGQITDVATGAVLWAQAADLPMQPASTNKVLTAAAALLTLKRDARLVTTVVAADQRVAPGVVVLTGGGDPTLSAAPPGQDTWYRGAARIADLADQVRRSGIAVQAVQVDTGAYSGPALAPGWDPTDIDGGDVAPVEAVMLDGGRTQPATPESGRSRTPALDAGRALATALGVDPGAVTIIGAPPAGGRQIASVASPPLIERLRQLMNESDNVMAESTGREVAEALRQPRSFDGAVRAVTSALSNAGIDTGGTTLFDSSGLSVNDRVTARTLDGVVSAAAGDRNPALRPLLDVLPIAGGSGTLSNRYLDNDVDRASAGWLRAKTGSLTGTNALAGIITDASGRVLSFAFISNNAGPTGRTALDALAATLRPCGCTA